MSQYETNEWQRQHLKRMYAEKAELEKDAKEWDTPFDEPMTIAEAQRLAKEERAKWKSSQAGKG